MLLTLKDPKKSNDEMRRRTEEPLKQFFFYFVWLLYYIVAGRLRALYNDLPVPFEARSVAHGM